MNQVRKLVAPAGPTPRAGQIVAGRSGSGWAEGRKQARGGQPLSDPERLIVGEFRVGGGIEYSGEELVHAGAALVGGASHPGDQFIRSAPGDLSHACTLAGVTPPGCTPGCTR